MFEDAHHCGKRRCWVGGAALQGVLPDFPGHESRRRSFGAAGVGAGRRRGARAQRRYRPL